MGQQVPRHFLTPDGPLLMTLVYMQEQPIHNDEGKIRREKEKIKKKKIKGENSFLQVLVTREVKYGSSH